METSQHLPSRSRERRQQKQTPARSDKRKRSGITQESQQQQQQQQQQQRKKQLKTAPGSNTAARKAEEEATDNPHAQQDRETQNTKERKTTRRRDRAENAVMEHLESDDYFEILGLVTSATDAEVKKAYRKLAVQWHPDKNRTHPQAEEYFKKIGEAYAVLSDPEKRKVYERYGKAGVGADADRGSYAPGNAAYHDPFGFEFASGGFHAGFSARHARDIFDAFFGGMDPFEDFFSRGGSSSHHRHQSRHRSNEWDSHMGGMGFGNMGMSMHGFGGGFGGGFSSMMMDPFFGGGAGGGAFADFGSFGGGFSQSVSSSSFTDRNGHVITNKTTTTVDADGRAETITEEFRNGYLVNSTSSSSNRLADAGRMQMQLETNNSSDPWSQQPPRRLSSSRSRNRF